MTEAIQNVAFEAPTTGGTLFVDRLKQQLTAMNAADQFECVGELMSFLSVEFSEAAQRAFAARLPRIKKIAWNLEYSHDDKGGMFEYINDVTYTREDGVEVSFGNIDEELEEYVRHVGGGAPLGERTIEDPDLGVLNAFLVGDEQEEVGQEEGWEALYRAFAGFSGCDPKEARAAMESVWYSAEATREHTGWDCYNLQ